MKKYLILSLVAFFITGCATQVQKDWGVIGGSKADGTVRLSFEYNEMEEPQTSELQAQELANRRCSAWGYKRAEPFDSASINCIYGPGVWGGCARFKVTMDYQCID